MTNKKELIDLLKEIKKNKDAMRRMDGEYSRIYSVHLQCESMMLQEILWMLEDEDYFNKMKEIYLKKDED